MADADEHIEGEVKEEELDPEREAGNYAPTVLPRRYDAFVYLDATRALHPLHEVRPRPAEEVLKETAADNV